MLKWKFELEIDEERLKEMFEGQEYKFTKKKIAELKKDLKENEYYLEEDMQARFDEVIEEWIANNFDE